MKDSNFKENEMSDDSLIGLSAQLKGLSEDENNSHGDKDTKTPITSNKPLNEFMWLLKEGKGQLPKRFEGKISDFNYSLKKENASGTGYLCDDDDGRDEEFQNG